CSSQAAGPSRETATSGKINCDWCDNCGRTCSCDVEFSVDVEFAALFAEKPTSTEKATSSRRRVDVRPAESCRVPDSFRAITPKTIRNAAVIRDPDGNAPPPAREVSGARQSSARHPTIHRDHRPAHGNHPQ